MEPGSDLDQALYEDTFAAEEMAPNVLPEFMRSEILAAVERRAPKLKVNIQVPIHLPRPEYVEPLLPSLCLSRLPPGVVPARRAGRISSL